MARASSEQYPTTSTAIRSVSLPMGCLFSTVALCFATFATPTSICSCHSHCTTLGYAAMIFSAAAASVPTPVSGVARQASKGTPPRGKAECLRRCKMNFPRLAWLSRIRNDPLGQRWRSSWAQASLFPSQSASSIVSKRVAPTAQCSVARRLPAGTWQMQQNHTRMPAPIVFFHHTHPILNCLVND
jgi:hypothetical protein